MEPEPATLTPASGAHGVSVDGPCPWHPAGVMNVALSPELEELIDAKVESGLYDSANKVVSDAPEPEIGHPLTDTPRGPGLL